MDSEIDAMRAECLHDDGIVGGLDGDSALWEALFKLAEDRGNDELAAGGRGANPKSSDAPFAEFPEFFSGKIHFLEDALGVDEELLACLRKDNRFAHSVQKSAPGGIFESLHGVAYCRL